jgi:hypothetical protein
MMALCLGQRIAPMRSFGLFTWWYLITSFLGSGDCPEQKEGKGLLLQVMPVGAQAPGLAPP